LFAVFVVQAIVKRKKNVKAVTVDKRTLRDVEFYNSLTDHRRQDIARDLVKKMLFAHEK